MPAARGQSAEDGAASCVFVEVERLRIEFRRERLDALLADGDPARAVDLARGEVLEIFFAHVSDLLCSGHISGPNHAPPATAAALMSPKAASARLCARKTCDRLPLQRSASVPASAAIGGHSKRPAPCEAKYSASASPSMP